MIKRKSITIDEEFAKRFTATVMQRAAAGQPFVITRNGVPWARMVAFDDKRRRV